MSNFNKQDYQKRIDELTGRAKEGSTAISDLDIGESCYLLALVSAVRLFRMKCISSDELYHRQKELKSQLLGYYQHSELFDRHISIRNGYSHVLTEAEKSGCSICRKLVRIFEGREQVT